MRDFVGVLGPRRRFADVDAEDVGAPADAAMADADGAKWSSDSRSLSDVAELDGEPGFGGEFIVVAGGKTFQTDCSSASLLLS